ncbi:MAG: TAXI family TRAP transporter solute-binding subunit [Methylococcales bacterium]|nr:TAXI family TRAP transporter solute-binding subunit [Methylococcales bacterium]
MSNSSSKRSYKDLISTFGPAVALILVGFWIAYQFVSPPPPKKISITTGAKTGAYYKIAQQYRVELAKEGIELEVMISTGSGENISRLINNEADFAFIQGGTGSEGEALSSLGSLYYEPLWIFLRKNNKVDKLTDLSGQRVAIGLEGSGTQILAIQLLERNQVNDKSAQLLSLSTVDAAKALVSSEIDAAMMVGSSDSEVIQQLLRNDQVQLLDLNRADAYTRLLPYLSKITLSEGIIDLKNNFPSQPITLLAPTANLVVPEDFNPALSVLLLRAAKKIHGVSSIFSASDDFPSSKFAAYPISEVADRFHTVGPPFLMRYLPFWYAVFIDRMIVMLVPLLALLLPLGKIMPPLYRWRIRSKIYRWYKELQEVDNSAYGKQITELQFKELNSELTKIENEVNKVKTPLSYADQVYNLLIHIDLVRKKLNAGQANN